MYRVLIADDEEIIRRGIEGFLKKDPEIGETAQAEDGETALEQADRLRPDLLFVDVNMPFLNGLDFIEKLKAILPDALVVVITGYDDFQYAQRALRLGVFDYLLKPIMEEVFYAALGRAKAELKRAGEQTRYLRWAKMLLEKDRPRLTEEFLNDWFGGHYSDAEAAERIGFLKLELPAEPGVTVAALDGRADAEGDGVWNDDLLYYAAENIAGEVFQPFSPLLFSRNANGCLVLLSSREPEGAWRAAADRFGETLERCLPVRAALAQAAGNGKEVPDAYERAAAQAAELRGVPQLVRDAQRYIDENFRNSGFSLQDAAAVFHVSPQHLSRAFRRAMGITFVDYVTRARIRRAVELLSDEEMKMYEIAGMTGYSSQHYFSSAFKKMLGVSPAEYRKNTHLRRRAGMV